MADAHGSGLCVRNNIWVQVSSSVLPYVNYILIFSKIIENKY